MIDRVQKYLELSDLMDKAFNEGDKGLLQELRVEFIKNKKLMTIEELESLELLVSKREYYEGIIPLIIEKKQKAFLEGISSINEVLATTTNLKIAY